MKFEKSADTKIIESVLAEAKIGETVTYETLSKAIGRDVRTFAFASLRSARHGLLQSKNYVFGVEQNVGLVRLDDDQIVDSTEDDRKRMQRAANRTIKKLGVVDYGKLSEDKKKQHVVASATMGAVALFSGKNAQKRIEQKVTPGTAQLAIGETLKLFS
jgi:hypothetical protein